MTPNCDEHMTGGPDNNLDQGEQNFYEAFSAAQESYDIRTSTPPEEVTVIGLKNIRTELVFMFTLTRYYFKQAIQGWGIGKAICGKHLFHSRNLCSVGIYALHLTNSSAHTLQWVMNTHTTHHEHAPGAVGSHFCLRHPGSNWGFSALIKNTSVMGVEGGRESCRAPPPPPPPPIPSGTETPIHDLSGYKSNSFNIRPQLKLLLLQKKLLKLLLFDYIFLVWKNA